MASSNAQRFLAKGGVDDELALEMFYGLVLEAFHAKTLLWNAIGPDGTGSDSANSEVVSSQVVSSGKSWQFPIIGEDGDPEYHQPGTELLGQQFEVDENTITIDDILVKHYDVPFDQIQKSHFDILRPLARKLGRSLATDFDKKLFIIGVKAAQTGSETKNGMTIHSGGSMIERVETTRELAWPATSAGATNFRDDAAKLAQLFDEDNVPEEGRFLIIDPYIRRVLGKDNTIFDSDLTAQRQNDINQRIIGVLEGFSVLSPTNHLPSTRIATGPAKYQGDFTAAGSEVSGTPNGGGGEGQPVALALCGADEGSAAIGYVAGAMDKVNPIYTFIGPDERRNTNFLKGQMMVGAGVLAPWCAGTIHVDSA